MAQGGEIFVLKMGTPVKIYEMAKNLLLLSGLEPGKDIEIISRTAPQQALVRKLKDLVPTFNPDAAHGVGA